MAKIKALYINEMIKILKKKSVFIISIIFFLICISITFLTSDDFEQYDENNVDTYSAYLSEFKNTVPESGISESIYNEMLDMLEPYEKDDGYAVDLPGYVNKLMNIKWCLQNNISSAYGNSAYFGSKNLSNSFPLSDDEKEYLLQQESLYTYIIENKVVSSTLDCDVSSGYSQFASVIFIVGIFCLVLLMLILAGGMISNEISTGSIKSLIIAPVKRSKIITSKLFALITVGVVYILFIYIIGIVLSLIVFGNVELLPRVFYFAGSVHGMNYYLYAFIMLLFNYVDIFVFMSFAFMLSCITKNTATSVGLSIGTYYAASAIFTLLNYLVDSKIVMFFPFNNLGLGEKFFSNTIQSEYVFGARPAYETSFEFSAVYLTVICALMIYASYESFRRRDI